MTKQFPPRTLPLFRRRYPAISELIGVVLLIAVIAGLMGILSVMLLGQPAPAEVPHFSYTGCVNEDGTIILTHTGGESIGSGIGLSAYRINVLDAGKKILYRTNLSDEPGTWSFGGTISVATGLDPSVIDATQIVVSTSKGETLVQWNEMKGSYGKLCGCVRTINASAGPGGSITPSGNVTGLCDSAVTVIITPDPCYRIDDVLVNGTSAGPVSSYQFTLPVAETSLQTIHATFSPLGPFAINASAGQGGTITPSGIQLVACGNTSVYSITADTCNSISTVLVNGIPAGPMFNTTSYNHTFTNIQSNQTISASFNVSGTYTITASAGSGGSISPSGSVSVPCGGSQTFTITPDPCSTITGVLVDGNPVGPVSTYTFSSVSSDHTIQASFITSQFLITTSVNPPSGGSIAVNGPLTVPCHESRVITITPAHCYSLTSVNLDGSTLCSGTCPSPFTISGAPFSDITSNHSISATFSPMGPFTITAYTEILEADGSTKPGGGTISPSGTFAVPCGADQSFTIAADKDHTFSDLMDNGVSMGAASPYTLIDITEDHVIIAQFVEGCELFTGHVYDETTGQGVAGIRVEQWSADRSQLIRWRVTNGEGMFSIPSPINNNAFFDLKCPTTPSWVTTRSYMSKFNTPAWQTGEWRNDVQENPGSSKCNPYLEFYGYRV